MSHYQEIDGQLDVITSDDQLIEVNYGDLRFKGTIFDSCFHFTGGDTTFWSDHPYDVMMEVIKILCGKKVLVGNLVEDHEMIEIVRYYCPTYEPESELKTHDLPVYANTHREISGYSSEKKRKENDEAHLLKISDMENEWEYERDMQDWYDLSSREDDVPLPKKNNSSNKNDYFTVKTVRSNLPYEEDDFYVE